MGNSDERESRSCSWTRRRWDGFGRPGCTGVGGVKTSPSWTGAVLPPERPHPSRWHGPGIHAAWLGHSTVLLQIEGITILTDPVFSRRVGIGLGPVGTPPVDWYVVRTRAGCRLPLGPITVRCWPGAINGSGSCGRLSAPDVWLRVYQLHRLGHLQYPRGRVPSGWRLGAQVSPQLRHSSNRSYLLLIRTPSCFN